MTHSVKQMVALIAGGTMGLVCLAGLSILLYRRVTNARITAATRKRDWLLLSWILGALLLGLLTITESAKHSDGEVMVQLMMWAQHLLTFQGDAASFMLDAPWLFKLHMLMGMTLFVFFPFTRLVHVWSGFASVTYLIRPWQLVRKR